VRAVGAPLALSTAALAAPRAADLGPQVTLAEPAGGYVGQLSVAPAHGPAGTPLKVTGEGFPAEQQLDLVWRTVKGRWKVTTAEYHGREFTPIAYRIATVKSDKAGRIAASFTRLRISAFCTTSSCSRGAVCSRKPHSSST